MGREADSRQSPVAPHPHLPDYYSDVDDRRRFVNRLFDRGARHYTWINHVMSFGTGVWYRREALLRAGLQPGMQVLDVCVGSGQVARAASGVVGSNGTVVALDASFGMLLETRKRIAVPSMQGLVEAIPVVDEFADFVTMGYALRHLADLRCAFSEFKRVLRPGGTLLMIEFARPTSRAAYHALKLYLHRIVPGIARLGSREAATMMRYFWDTIEHCVPPRIILDTLQEVGFERAAKGGQIELLAEYTAQKPA